jgi:hypothetical protein
MIDTIRHVRRRHLATLAAAAVLAIEVAVTWPSSGKRP